VETVSILLGTPVMMGTRRLATDVMLTAIQNLSFNVQEETNTELMIVSRSVAMAEITVSMNAMIGTSKTKMDATQLALLRPDGTVLEVLI